MLMQTHENRLAALREELGRLGLTGFVVPIADDNAAACDSVREGLVLSLAAGSATGGAFLSADAAEYIQAMEQAA